MRLPDGRKIVSEDLGGRAVFSVAVKKGRDKVLSGIQRLWAIRFIMRLLMGGKCRT